MRRYLWVVLLVGLTAGCAAVPFAGAGGGADAERFTPVPVTTDERTVAVEGARPAWLAPDGTVRVDRLRAAHLAALGGRSYTWTFRMTRDERGAVIGGNEIVRRVRTNGTATLVEQRGATLSQTVPIYVTRATDYTFRGVGFRRVSAGLYVTGTTARLRVETSTSTRVDRVDVATAATHYAFTPTVLDRYLGGGTTVNVSVAEVDGQRLYRLYVPPGNPPRTLNRSAGPASTVWNYTATAYVTRSGFVRTLVVAYDQRSATQNHRVSIRMDYSAVGQTTVGRPAWAAPTTGTPPPGAGNRGNATTGSAATETRSGANSTRTAAPTE